MGVRDGGVGAEGLDRGEWRGADEVRVAVHAGGAGEGLEEGLGLWVDGGFDLGGGGPVDVGGGSEDEVGVGVGVGLEEELEAVGVEGKGLGLVADVVDQR